MSNDYVTDGKIGIDLTATYASTSAGSTSLFPVTPGTRVNTSSSVMALMWERFTT